MHLNRVRVDRVGRKRAALKVLVIITSAQGIDVHVHVAASKDKLN